MTRIKFWIVAVGFLLLIAGMPTRSLANGIAIDQVLAPNADSPLGTNLSPLADWSSEYVFLDPFKQSRPWITQNAATWDTDEADLLQLDANGWVTRLPAANDPTQYRWVATVMFHALDGHYPAGQYIVHYEGEGTIEYGYDAAKIVALSRPGRDVVQVTPGSNRLGFFLRITATDPRGTGNYIRNIRVQMPGFGLIDPTTGMFHPHFIDSIKHYRILRFMDWMRTNWDANGPIRADRHPQTAWTHPLHDAERNPYLRQRDAGTRNANLLIDWSDRPKPGDLRFSSERGVPAEIMISLANTIDADPWFNMPHNASDDYIQRFAELTRATLEPQRRAYVEYSNEVWNGGFYQATWVGQQAAALWPDPTISALTKRLSWYGKRSAEMCSLWKTAFADQADRVVCVISGQANNYWIAEQMLDCPLWVHKPCYAHGIDALAIAPYFGSHIGLEANQAAVTAWTNQPDGGLASLFQELEFGNLLPRTWSTVTVADAKTNMGRHISVANGRDLVLLAYEGGQHLVGVGSSASNAALTTLFNRANRDPRMAPLYADYLEHWDNVGGQFHLHFASTGLYSQWGSWGSQEYLRAIEAHKRDALSTFITTHECDWALCVPAAGSGATAVQLRTVAVSGATNRAQADASLLPALALLLTSVAVWRRRD